MSVKLSALEEECYREDRERAARAVEEGTAAFGPDGGGERAAVDEAASLWLVRLAELGDTRGVKELIDAGMDPDLPDPFGQYALLGAAQFGRLGTLRLLLGKSCDMTVTDSLGRDALMVAASRGAVHAMELLLALGAPLDRRSWRAGNSALHYAAWNGHARAVALLAENGSPLNLHNHDGMTPLMYAARDGHQPVVRRLIQRGASVAMRNPRDHAWAALHYAAAADRAPVLHTLIHAGADLAAATEEGETARDIAERAHADMAAALLRERETRGRLARHRMRARRARNQRRAGGRSPAPARGASPLPAGGGADSEPSSPLPAVEAQGAAGALPRADSGATSPTADSPTSLDGPFLGSGIAPEGTLRWRPEDSSSNRIFAGVRAEPGGGPGRPRLLGFGRALSQEEPAAAGDEGGHGGGAADASPHETRSTGAAAVVAESVRLAHARQ